MNKPRVALPLLCLLAALVAISALRTPITWAQQGEAVRPDAPPLPSTFYGSVRLDGANVPAGTLVTAWINNIQFAQTTTIISRGVSVYRLDVPGDDPDTPGVEGGRVGDTVRFQVEQRHASPQAAWRSGTPTQFNLNASSVPTPTPTPPPGSPSAAFGVGKAMNVISLEEGATVTEFSSVNTNQSNHRPQNAIDNSPSSTWMTATGQPNNQSLTVRLAYGGNHVVNRAILRGATNPQGMKDFVLQLSPTGAPGSYTSVVTGTIPNNDLSHEFVFPAFRASYVRLLVLNNWGATSTYVTHFELWTRERQGGIVSLREGPPATIMGVSSESHTSTAADRAIDEASGTRWQTASGQIANQWVTVGLGGGRLYTINRIQLRGYDQTSGIRDFEVKVSTGGTDPSHFTTVLSGTMPRNNTTLEFSFPAVTARYVQLVGKNNHGGTQLTVDTFRVLTPDGANAARLEGVGSFILGASSEGQPAINAFDFSQSTSWQSGSNQVTNQWIRLRLLEGGPHLVDRVSVQAFNNTASPKRFQLGFSTTGTEAADFTTVVSATLPSDGLPHWYLFPPIPAKYFQIYIFDNHGSTNVIQLKNVQVYSSQLGGATVPFDDHSVDQDGSIVGWQWAFGDGTTSTERFPVHTFPAPGVYPVSLTVTDNEGKKTKVTQPYTAFQGPTGSYVWTPLQPLEGQNLRFNATASAAYGPVQELLWNFPHTSNTPTGAQVFQTFPDSDGYPVRLTITDHNLLSHVVTHVITPTNLPPTVEVGPNATRRWGERWESNVNPSDPGTVDRTSLHCRWVFGDGTTAERTTCMNYIETHFFPLPGIYTPTLTVTDRNGGSVTDSTVITVNRRESQVSLHAEPVGVNGGALLARARLYDTYDMDLPRSGQVLSFSNGIDTVTSTTGTDGTATVLLPLTGSTTVSVTATFAGNSMYLPDTDLDVLSSLSVRPQGDIVFIVDESGSMQPNIDAIRSRIAEIANGLSASIDFQLGLVGFGARAPHGPVTTWGTPHLHLALTDDVARFEQSLGTLTTDGEAEPGLTAIEYSMGNVLNFREDAGICVIIVTNESSNADPAGTQAKARAIAALKARQAIFFGIVATDLSSQNEYGPAAGSPVAETGGLAFPINTFVQNADPVLQAILSHCIEAIVPDLSIDVTDGRTAVAPGEQITYTLTISNSGAQDALGIALTDTLPVGTTFLGASNGGSLMPDGRTVAWPLFALSPEVGLTRTVTVQVNPVLPSDVLTFTNEVGVFHPGAIDPTPADNVASDVDTRIATLDLALTKRDGGQPVAPGEALTYTLHYTNSSILAAPGAVLTETLPANTSFNSAASSPGWEQVGSSNVYRFPLGTLAPDATGQVTFGVTVAAPMPPGVTTLQNVARIGDDGSQGNDAQLANNTGTVTTPLIGLCEAGKYDVDGDGRVSVIDIQRVASDFLDPDFLPAHDVNCSGAVDVADTLAVGEAWQP